MSAKMIKCKACHADIASSAKTCPQCGAKNKKPIYTKWWFYAAIILVVAIAVGNAGGTGSQSENRNSEGGTPARTSSTKEPISYTHYNVTELFDALKENALKAKETYNNQYVELEGYLSNIDSDGKYISIGAGEGNYDYIFQSVQCYIKSDEQKAVVMEMGINDPIIIRGKIKSVGEVLGYSLDIDSIG